MQTRLSLKIIVMIALCAGSVISTARAVDYSQPINNAARIAGFLYTQTAILAECADYDKQNARSYSNLMSEYIEENKNLTDRIMTIMRTETFRTGHTFEGLSNDLSVVKNRARNDVGKMRRENPNFLNICRAQEDAHKRGLGNYRPIREKYPDQMRVIDDWK